MSALCVLCARQEPRVGLCCYRCRDRVNDLVSPHNEGSRFNPARPDDPVVWPSVPVLLALVAQLDAQRSSTVGLAGGGSSVFRSSSPADDHVLALRDRRTQPGEEFAALAARRWLLYTCDVLCAMPEVTPAVRELRALQTHLLGVTGNGLARSVGECAQLVDDNGRLMSDGEVKAVFATAKPGSWPVGVWRCATPLYVPVLPPRAADEPVRALPTLRCGGCGYAYSGYELVQLGRRQESA